MRRVITSDEILLLARQGGTRLVVDEPYTMTDLAKEQLKRYHIEITTGGAAPAEGTGMPMPVLPQQSPPRAQTRPMLPRTPEPAASAAADLLIRGGTVVLPEIGLLQADLAVKDGRVLALTKGDIPAAQVLDARGLHVLPGIIDPHTHIGLMAPPEVEWESESRSALIGGVTAAGCFLSQPDSYLPTLQRLEGVVRQHSRIDAFFHLTLREPVHLEELAAYRDRGVSSFKMYMYGVPGVMPHQEDGFIVEAMGRLKALRGSPVLCIHAENASMIEHARSGGELRTLEDWAQTHPDLSESDAVLRAAYLGRELGVRVYAVHVSTRDSVEILPRAREDGMLVETTSPYLTIDNQNGPGTLGKMLPPFRGPESVEALWRGVEAGLVDTIGTDNVTVTMAQKQPETMEGAFPGYPALATHLPSVVNEGVHRRGIPIEKLVPLMTMNPAKIFGVYPRKGTLLPGSDADIALLDLNAERLVDPGILCSRSDFSLYQGKRLRGWPRATIKGGKVVMWDGRIVDDVYRGNILLR